MLIPLIGWVAKIITVAKTVKSSYDTVTKTYDDVMKRTNSDYQTSEVDKRFKEIGLSQNNIDNKLVNIEKDLAGFSQAMREQTNILSAVQTSIVGIQNGVIENNLLLKSSIAEIVELQRAVYNLDTKIDKGFINLQYFVSGQIGNVLDFQKNLELTRAYELYVLGLNEIKRHAIINDVDISRATLISAIDKINQSAVIYNSYLKSGNLKDGAKLKSQQAVFIAEATLAEIYLAVGEIEAGKDIYSELSKKTKEGLREIILEAQGNMKNLAIQDSRSLNGDLAEIQKKLKD